MRDRLVALSPARDVPLPKIQRNEPAAFNVDEVMRLADTIESRHRALVLVGAFGGLRFGELAVLQLGDFDPHRSLVHVRRTASDVQGQLIVGPPKTIKSIRTVVLPHSISNQLAQHTAHPAEADPGASNPVIGALGEPVLFLHGDTFDPTPGAEVLAKCPQYPHAFHHGSAVGVQPHPEVSSSVVREWAPGFERSKLERSGINADDVLERTVADDVENQQRALATFGAWPDEVLAA